MSRWIDADKVLKIVNDMTECEDDYERITEWIHNMPSIDIVRCKECKWCLIEDGGCERIGMVLFADEIENHFCGYGERRE